MEFITQNIQRMIELFRKSHNKDSRNEPTSSWSLRTVFPQRSGRTTIETRTLICTNEERKDIPSPGKTKRWMIILRAESTEIYCLNPKQDFRIILGKEKREWQSSLWPADSLSCVQWLDLPKGFCVQPLYDVLKYPKPRAINTTSSAHPVEAFDFSAGVKVGIVL